MKVIAGLGNPTGKYSGTRHNVGFMAVDRIAKENHISVETLKHRALCGKGTIGGEKVLLIKPQTFMNCSGESLREVVDYYKLDPSEDVIIIYDDISLEVGRLRLRAKGSAGGHNGIKSIIACLGTEQFQRIRIGVGEKPTGYDLADYVLGRFDRQEQVTIEEALEKVAKATELILSKGLGEAMNQFN